MQYQAILSEVDLTGFDLSSLRLAVVAGSVTPRPLGNLIRSKLCGALFNDYGSTEVGCIAFGHTRGRRARFLRPPRTVGAS